MIIVVAQSGLEYLVPELYEQAARRAWYQRCGEEPLRTYCMNGRTREAKAKIESLVALGRDMRGYGSWKIRK